MDAPDPPPARRQGQAKTPQPFVKLAIAAAVATVVAFVLTQLLFGIGGWLDVVGYMAFAVTLGSVVVTIVGVIGAIVRSVR
jgi:hypothetical protein